MITMRSMGFGGELVGQWVRSVVDCIQDSLTFERQTFVCNPKHTIQDYSKRARYQ